MVHLFQQPNLSKYKFDFFWEWRRASFSMTTIILRQRLNYLVIRLSISQIEILLKFHRLLSFQLSHGFLFIIITSSFAILLLFYTLLIFQNSARVLKELPWIMVWLRWTKPPLHCSGAYATTTKQLSSNDNGCLNGTEWYYISRDW